MVLETIESFRKLVTKDRFPKLKNFALTMRSTFGNTCMCESTCSMKKQIKFKNRNLMADKTPDHSLQIATTNTGIDKGMMCQRSLDHRHPTDGDL